MKYISELIKENKINRYINLFKHERSFFSSKHFFFDLSHTKILIIIYFITLKIQNTVNSSILA